MPKPPDFDRTHSWLDDQTNSQPLDGNELDSHFDQVSASVNAINDGLSELRNDDGGLRSDIVTEDALNAAVLDSVASTAQAAIQPDVEATALAASAAASANAAAQIASGESEAARDTAVGSVGGIAALVTDAEAARDAAQLAQTDAETASTEAGNAQNAAEGAQAAATLSEETALEWAELLSGPVMPPDPLNPTPIPPGSAQDWIDAVAQGHFSARWWAWWLARRQDVLLGLPAGGLTGEVLAKQSDAEGDYYWATVAGGGGPETDPVFTASVAAGITAQDVLDWAQAHGWGDHAAAGYAAAVHTHGITDVTGLQAALDGKLEAGDNVSVLVNDAGYISAVALLTDVGDVASGQTDGQVLIWNNAASQWQPGTIAGGGGTLDGLSDVTVTTPATGEVLRFDGAQWVNAALVAADVGYTPGGTLVATDVQAALDELEVEKAVSENGFVDKVASTLAFTDGTRTFSIQPVATDFEFFSDGKRYISTGDTVVIPDLEGNHFFYYDASGTLVTTQTFVDEIITDWAFVSYVYWDATNKAALTLAEERHGNTMDSATHLYNHNTTGTRYGTGLQVGDLSTDGSGDVAADAQFSVTGGVIWDEDLDLVIGSEALGSLNVRHFYKTGPVASPVWRTLPSNGFVVPDNGAARATWNDPNGGGAGVWGRTEVTNNDFVLAHLWATNDVNNPWILVMGEADYDTLTAAREGAITELLSITTEGLFVVEYQPVATFICQTSGGYSNDVATRVRTTDTGDEYIDWRTVSVGAIVAASGSSTQIAAQVPFTPAGGIAATDVQAALEELDAEKAALVHTHVKADITDFADGDYATAAQGALADTATQPGDLATVATTGVYSDLTGIPATFVPSAHTHVKADITDFADADYATAAQGATADTATQPGDDADTLGSGVATDGQVLTADGVGGAAWEDAAGGGPGGLTVQTVSVNTGAVAGTHYHVDTAGVTIALPAAPAAGDQVAVSVDNFADVVIGHAGIPINGVLEDFAMDLADSYVLLRYVDATEGWAVVGANSGAAVPASFAYSYGAALPATTGYSEGDLFLVTV